MQWDLTPVLRSKLVTETMPLYFKENEKWQFSGYAQLQVVNLKSLLKQEALMQKHFKSMLLIMLLGWADKKEVKNETRILHLQSMLHVYANE